MAISLNLQDFHCESFKASDSWLLNWKKKNRICSRYISKFVTKQNHKDKDEIEKAAKE